MYHPGQMSSIVACSANLTFLCIYVCRKQLPLPSVSSLAHKEGTFPCGSKERRCYFSLSTPASQERSYKPHVTGGKDWCTYLVLSFLIQAFLAIARKHPTIHYPFPWQLRMVQGLLRRQSLSNMLSTCSDSYWPFERNLSGWTYSVSTYHIFTNLVKMWMQIPINILHGSPVGMII